MMDTGKSIDLLEFETVVNLLYNKVKSKNMNYYELLGISTTATQRETEAAYKNYSQEFSEVKANAVSDSELQKKAMFLVNLGKRAYEVLTNFEKRAQYEKTNYRDVDPQSLKEVEPVDKAREIYKKAKNLYSQKNYPLAVKAMEEAISYDPNKPDYYQLMGLCQTQIPDMRRKAEVNLKKALELESWNAEHLVALGMLFHAEKLYKKAEAFYRKALEIEPNHVLALKRLREITGPEASTMDKVQAQLGKYMPTFFGKKKK
jgi:tetratricopeptide (TPR) repeat protein